MMIYHLFQPC